ncbi:MAG: hypothetical protein LBF93_07635 [Zoogloeaceae bacterium]|jgi:hypothetical protein|nr:hypothetical protein [Zoogloeaceae bacterium]
MTNEEKQRHKKRMAGILTMLAEGAETMPDYISEWNKRWARLKYSTRRWIIGAALRECLTDGSLDEMARCAYSEIPTDYRVKVRVKVEKIGVEIERIREALRIGITD